MALLSLAEADFTPRIVGGKDTDLTSPWIAALVFDEETDIFFGQYCAGSLVHPYWVATAAHCVDFLLPENVDVVLGIQDLNDPSFTRVNVLEIVTHPDYFSILQGSDLALLLLETPAAGFEVLPVIEDTSLAAPGVEATILGWGATTNDPEDPMFPTMLQEARLPIVSLATANQPQSYDGDILPNMLPAGFAEGGVDTCGADSGSPLLVPGAGGNGFVLAGITSFGDGCAEPDKYGIYTRVSDFRSWIKSIVVPHYAQWEEEHAISGEGSDADADGLTNFHEYLLGSDPNIPSSLDFPEATTASISNTVYPALRFRKRKEADQLHYSLERSTDLLNWTSLDIPTYRIGSPQSLDSDTEEVTVRADISLDAATPVFLRLVGKFSENLLPSARHIGSPDFIVSILLPSDFTDPLRTSQTFYVKDFNLVNPPLDEPVKVSLISDEVDPYLQIINAGTGQLVDSDNNSGIDNNSLITFSPQQNIDYILRVSTWDASDTGNFILSTSSLFDATPIGFPDSINGNLTLEDETDPNIADATFKFDDYILEEVTANQPVKIRLLSVAGGNGFDALLVIFDALTGLPVAFDDDSGVGLNASIMLFTPPDNSDLIIRVTSATELGLGSYTLTTGTAPTISPNQTRSGALSSSDETDPFYSGTYYKDDYLISGLSPGQSITIEMTATSGLDTYIELVDASAYNLIDFDDDSGSGLNSRLTFTVQSGVTYILRATSALEEATGSYSVRVF